jgi:hypothetical protein
MRVRPDTSCRVLTPSRRSIRQLILGELGFPDTACIALRIS